MPGVRSYGGDTVTKYQALAAGFLIMGYLVAALFFLRFWQQTADRFFAFFASSFALLAVQRMALVLVNIQENTVWLYGLRLVAYLLILAAIIEKNRAAPSSG